MRNANNSPETHMYELFERVAFLHLVLDVRVTSFVLQIEANVGQTPMIDLKNIR